jgi:putative ABC transport system ATP-binding protein
MIACEGLAKRYAMRSRTVDALTDVSLVVSPGEFVVVRGPSGSGKTTLLLTLGGMLRPTAGMVRVDGTDLYGLSEAERAAFRARRIGFVFQMFHLVPYLTAIENVLLPAGAGDARADRGRAAALLEEMGLVDRANHKPAELSAGERQRTAIARALYREPAVILADEPTGNLDPDNAAATFEHLAAFHKAGGTVIVVTHGHEADAPADRVVRLREGRIVAEGNAPTC